MAFPDFLSLLKQALQGDSFAVTQWIDYSADKKFTNDEITLGLEELEKAYFSNSRILKSQALVLRGIWHYFGIGTKENLAKAIQCYEQALEMENSTAMVLRATLHEEGEGGNKNLEEATKLYKRAIKLGNSDAMVQYADIYQGKAIEYYAKAIEAGNTKALVNCGVLNELGVGNIKANTAKAIEFYDKAIDSGNTMAMNYRARMYEFGLGCEKDLQKAAALYDKAIALGNVKAIWNKVNMAIHEKHDLNNELICIREAQLDKILKDLEQKIKKINAEHFTESSYVANNLLCDLKRAKERYVRNYRARHSENTTYEFEKECEKLIEKARPVLERDLAWGIYLTNLLKALVNFISKIFSLGQVKTFFPLAKAELLVAVEEAHSQLTI